MNNSTKPYQQPRKVHKVLAGGMVLALLGLAVSALFKAGQFKQVEKVSAQEGQTVTIATPLDLNRIFKVNVPSFFKELVTMTALTVEGESIFGNEVTFENEVVFDGQLTLNSDVFADGINIDLGSGEITASNIIYSLEEGSGISISDGQNPTISVTDLGSSQHIFKKIKVGSDTAEADENSDTLEFAAGAGISVSIDTGSDKLTITNSALPGFVKSGTYALLADGVTSVGVGTSTPGNTFEVNSGTVGTSGFSFTQLTSSSTAGVGGGKVLSLDSGGRIILVADQTGDATPSAEAILPSATNGMTLYFNGTNWAASDNLFHDGGSVGISNAAPTSRLHVNTNLASKIGVIVQGYTSQAANLQEWRDSTGSTLSYIDENGVFNGSANVSGSLNPGLTNGSVLFQGPSGITQDNTNFYWDDTNDALLVGTNTNGQGVFKVNTAGDYVSVEDDLRIEHRETTNYFNFIHGSSGTLSLRYNSAITYLTLDNAGNFNFDSGDMYIENATNRVGIGTTAPNTTLNVAGAQEADASYGNLLIHTTNAQGGGLGGYLGFGGRYSTTDTTIAQWAGIRGAKENGTDDNAAGYLSFLTRASGGSTAEKMRITSAGNVGVGVANPGSTVPSLYNNIAGSKLLQISSADTDTDTGLFLRRSDNATGLDIWTDNGSGLTYIDSRYNNNAGNIHFRTRTAGTAVDAMTILGSGNVGIGTTGPNSKLHITTANGVDSRITLSQTGAQNWSLGNPAGTLRFDFSEGIDLTTPRLSIRSGGNIGIGTTVPGAKLDIIGDLFAPTATFSANYAGGIALKVVGGPSANTTHIMSVQNNSGTTLMAVDGFGRASVKASGTSNTDFMVGGTTGNENLTDTLVYFLSRSASQKGLVVRGAASQTASLTEWQDSSGNILASVNPRIAQGNATLFQVNPSNQLIQGKLVDIRGYSSSTIDFSQSHSPGLNSGLDSPVLRFGGNWNNSGTTNTGYGGMYFSPTNGGAETYGKLRLGIATSGGSSLPNSALTIYQYENRVGLVGINTDSPLAQLHVTPNYSGQIGEIIQAASSQTANLTEWRNSSGTVLSVVDESGNIGVGTSDPGYKLQVIGTTSLNGDVNIAGAQLYVTGNSSYLNFSGDNYLGGGTYFRSTSGTNTNAFINGNGGASTNTYFAALSGNVGIGTTTPTSKLDVTTNALGVTQTATSGLALVNSTAAALGAQQISPAVRWTGQGWRSNATAASQPVEFQAYVLPVEGAAAPTGQWLLRSSINSAAYATKLVVNSNAGETYFETNGVRINGFGGNIGGISLNGSATIQNTFQHSAGFSINNSGTPAPTGVNILSIGSAASSATSGTTNLLSVNTSFTPTSGTGLYTNLLLNPTINQTGGANGITRGLFISPTLTAAADWRGIEIANNSGYGIYQSGASALNYFAGSVGIGTATPVEKLSVNGHIRLPKASTLNWSASASVDYGDAIQVDDAPAWLSGLSNVMTFSTFGNSGSTGAWVFRDSSSGNAKVTIMANAGNVGIGTTTFGTSAVNALAIAGSTAPTTSITDGIQLFAVDVAGSHELQVRDEAGNTTTLSPHNFSVIGDKSEELAWSFYSERNSLAINADMTKALRIVEKLSGEKLIYLKDLASGQLLEDENDATRITELADNGSIGEVAKWNYTLWTYIGEVIFEKPVQFLAQVTFNGKAVFSADAWFGGRTTFADKDMAGKAVIKAGATEVSMVFDKPYQTAPLVTITPQGSWVEAYVVDASTTGFTIRLQNVKAEDAHFAWQALTVIDAQTTISGDAPTPSPPATAEPTPEASPVATPVASPLASPVPSIEPSPTPVIVDPVASSSAETP